MPSNRALQTDKVKLSRLVHSQEPRQLAFDERELLILSEHKHALNRMIRDALGRGHSVCGAYFTAHFGINENLDL